MDDKRPYHIHQYDIIRKPRKTKSSNGNRIQVFLYVGFLGLGGLLLLRRRVGGEHQQEEEEPRGKRSILLFNSAGKEGLQGGGG